MFNCAIQYFFNSHQLVLAMMVFLAIIVLLVLFIMIMMMLAQYRQRHVSALNDKLDDLVSQLTICEDQYEFENLLASAEVSKMLVDITSSKQDCLVVIRKLSQASVSLKGIALEHVIKLYKRLDLTKIIYKELKSWQWHRRAHAVQAIARFEDQEAVDILLHYINDKNIHVRTEAQIGLVRLKGFDGLSDLIYMTYNISEWQHICLIDELSYHQFNHVWLVRRMLQVHNECIIILGLKIALIHTCFDLVEDIEVLRLHPSKKVREYALVVIKELSEEEVIWI
jgi:hypothetical protein